MLAIAQSIFGLIKIQTAWGKNVSMVTDQAEHYYKGYDFFNAFPKLLPTKLQKVTHLKMAHLWC